MLSDAQAAFAHLAWTQGERLDTVGPDDVAPAVLEIVLIVDDEHRGDSAPTKPEVEREQSWRVALLRLNTQCTCMGNSFSSSMESRRTQSASVQMVGPR
jgi:hypothetical protein